MVTPSKLNGTSNQTGYEPGDHMTQQTFSFGSNPRVVINQVDANLRVRAWKEQIIRVETEGPVAELRQEGNTLVITNCNSDLGVPYPIF